MNKHIFKHILTMCFICMIFVCLTGCSKTAYDGKWAYIHDSKTVALTISGNKAEVDGQKCSVTAEGDILKLTAKDGTNYEIGPSDTKGQIILYKFTTYEYSGEGTPDGLVGIWKSKEDWSFEFTDQGTFKEDGYFPGYYSEDKENKTFSLVYNDHFVDTVCGYSIEGNNLTVKYPWPMVVAEN